jgi:signal-transduction protein with cAMP-binding, CBS, and nucleotidyltransferase domain
MRDNDCGSVPILDASGCLLGVVTDRDLAIRALAEGKGADVKAGELMTPEPLCCTAGADLREVERVMSDNQVRRVPIVNADGCCVGIVAQADLARAAQDDNRVSEHEVAVVVERISAPSTSTRLTNDRLRGDWEQRF